MISPVLRLAMVSVTDEIRGAKALASAMPIKRAISGGALSVASDSASADHSR
jgi:hypothetical protein